MPIRLIFENGIPDITRSRMEYAFRIFAAIYGYRVVDGNQYHEARNFIYGETSSAISSRSDAVRIPARYVPRSGNDPLPPFSKVHYADENFYLFHGLDPVIRQPDWLGEIFEWLSSSHENCISQRDDIGCIPDSEMIFGRLGLPTWKPQAALLMAWLEHVSQNGANAEAEALPKAPSPIDGTEHFVVCSHDVDFYFTNRRSAVKRLIKNLGISLLLYKSWDYFFSNSKMFLKLLGGERIGDYLPPLLERMEQHGSRSTFFVVPVHGHHRDPNYALSALAPQIQEAIKRGFSVEVHGSYSSILENHTLEPEAEALQQVTGKKALGNRQHWLRFDRQGKLFQTIEKAELLFDSSVGFSHTVGFRNGACFAFPPYDFKKEKPHNFLEIPLAIMDGCLVESSLATGASPETLAEQVLHESRKRGWGGISILWHNPLETISVPEEINQVFWKCAKNQQKFNEKWISSDQFLALALPRYQNAGLLTDVKPHTQGFFSPLVTHNSVLLPNQNS